MSTSKKPEAANVPTQPDAASDVPLMVTQPGPKRIQLAYVQLKRAPSGVSPTHEGGQIYYIAEPFPHVLVGTERYPFSEVAWFRFPLDQARLSK